MSQADQPKSASAASIVLTLCFAGVLAGLLLVVVYQATQPRIQAYKDKMLKLAVEEVLQHPASYQTLYLVDGKLTPDLPAGSSAHDFEQVFHGFDQQGHSLGFALVHARAGFQDTVRVIFGYHPQTGDMLGMRVLESKETPGLGDKIEKEAWFGEQFSSCTLPLIGVKAGKGTGDRHEVDMITGATISSRAVIRILNEAFTEWNPLLQPLAEEEQP